MTRRIGPCAGRSVWHCVALSAGLGVLAIPAAAARAQARPRAHRPPHSAASLPAAQPAEPGEPDGVRSREDLRQEAFGPLPGTPSYRPESRPSPAERRATAARRRSWNPYSASRARRFRLRSDLDQPSGAYGAAGAYLRDGFGRGRGDAFGNVYGYGPYAVFDAADYAEVFLNQSYYDDGPYGPGFYDRQLWYNWYIAYHRSSQLRGTRADRVDAGLAAFRSGRYERAAVALMGAARLDHTDAASRVHAGHALFAVGRYDAAVRHLARAFELAPRLATSSYDLRSDYGAPDDFDNHLNRLKAYVVANPDDADAITLLGYVIFYTKGPASAYEPLARAARLRPKDLFIPKLLDIARSVRPMANGGRAEKSSRHD